MRYIYLFISLALILIGIAIRVVDPQPLPQLRDAYFDSLQRLSPRDPADLPLRVVAIDEESLSELGQWPWPRSILAELTDRLAEYGAAVVAYDVIFAEEDRYSLSRLIEDSDYGEALANTFGPNALEDLDNDKRFAQVMHQMPVVLGTGISEVQSSRFSYDKAGLVLMGKPIEHGLWEVENLTEVLPVLKGAADGLAVVNSSPTDGSGIVRRLPLLWKHEDQYLPSLGLEALRVALGETTYFVETSRDVEDFVETIRVGQFAFPTTSSGELWVKYREETPATYVSASDVLNEPLNQEMADKLAGHIVFVGATAPGLFDIKATALGQAVPGVSVHVQMLEQAFTEDFLIRTEFHEGIEILLFVLLGIIVTVAITMKSSVITIISGVAAGGTLLMASYLGFTQRGVLLDITFPMIGGLVNFAIMGGYQFVIADRDKRLLRRSFSHYVAPSVLDEIEAAGRDIGLTGENKEITVMFADIRGFTAFSENRDPTQVVGVLNDLFSRLSGRILETSGTIDKFIGDSIMAFWSAPIEVADHAERGLHAAMKFRIELEQFNRDQREKDLPELALAIGFATGDACVGNIGSDQRFSYSAIGETVNLAARIEAACRRIGYDIVGSDLTAQECELASLPAGRLDMKGISERLPLHVFVGDEALAKSPEFLALRDAHFDLLEAVEKGGDHVPLLGKCIELGREIEPGLEGFYAKFENRLDDFGADTAE